MKRWNRFPNQKRSVEDKFALLFSFRFVLRRWINPTFHGALISRRSFNIFVAIATEMSFVIILLFHSLFWICTISRKETRRGKDKIEAKRKADLHHWCASEEPTHKMRWLKVIIVERFKLYFGFVSFQNLHCNDYNERMNIRNSWTNLLYLLMVVPESIPKSVNTIGADWICCKPIENTIGRFNILSTKIVSSNPLSNTISLIVHYVVVRFTSHAVRTM